MVPSRTAQIAVGLGARLLVIAVVVASMTLLLTRATPHEAAAMLPRRRLAVLTTPVLHHATCDDAASCVEMMRALQWMMVAAAMLAGLGCVLHIPVAVYLCKSRRLIAPSALVLDISLRTDVVVTGLLILAVGVGYGVATPATLRHVRWDVDERVRQDLIDYYNGAKLPVALLLVGTVLSTAAVLTSAGPIRDRAASNGGGGGADV